MPARPIAILALCLALVPAASPVLAADTPPDPVTVTVDFSQDLGAFRNIAAGFLGHVDSEPFRPSSAQLEGYLRPYMWRGDSFCATPRCSNNTIQDRAYQAVTNNGGVFQKVACKRFTERYGAECESLDTTSPWDESGDGATWFQDCYNDALEALAHNRNPQWDVWNEPNGAGIFRDVNDRLRGWELAETYRICHEALAAAYATRTSPPELTVGGPSMSAGPWALAGFLFTNGSPGQVYMAGSLLPGAEEIHYGDFGFLEYLNQHPGIGLDFLSLHLFADEWIMDWAGWIEILREAIREELRGSNLIHLKARWGADLANLPIYVNEMLGGPNDAYYSLDPGHTVVGFAQIHEANVDGAVRACWPDPADGSSGCSNKTLDGLLVPDGGYDPYLRRPAWWAYKYYAELSGRESAVLTEYPRVHGVAAADYPSQRYRVLLGFTSGSLNGDQVLTQNQLDRTDVVLTGLPADCAGATVTTKLLATSNHTQAFTENDLAYHQSSTEILIDGNLVVSVDDLASGNVLYIKLNTFGCDTITDLPATPTNLHRIDDGSEAP